MSSSIWSRCSPTPCTTSMANSSGGICCSASTSSGEVPFTSTSYSSPSARSRASRRVPRSADTSDVLPRPRVHLDPIALVHEQRHADRQAGLDRRRLATGGRAIALQPGLRLGDDEVDGCGQLHADDLVLV